MFRANDDAGGLQPNVGAVCAVVAFCCRAAVGVNVNSIVGASLHTRLAADADAVVKLYNAVGTLVHRLSGADAYAGRIGAVVAPSHLKVTTVVGEGARFDIFDPGSVHAERDFIFTFTGSGAGVAADAFPVINNETIIFRCRSSGERKIFCHNILNDLVAGAICRKKDALYFLKFKVWLQANYVGDAA